MASLTVSMGLQLLTVWGQYRNLGWQRVLREIFPVLIGFKPAVDAYRVAAGVKQEKGQAVDPMIEMTYMKIIELFAEAIPGVIIQLMAIATSKEVDLSSWVSLAFSTFTTGFVSATISYDLDTEPESRQKAPDFYGYIPPKASKRVLVFFSMIFMSAGMLLIRSTSIVLLGLVDKRWTFAYVGADIFMFFVIKVLRDDFWYRIRVVDGNTDILLSLLTRLCTKFVTDFTSLVQLRHPNEVGGANWLFGLLTTMISLPVVGKWFGCHTNRSP